MKKWDEEISIVAISEQAANKQQTVLSYQRYIKQAKKWLCELAILMYELV